MDVQYFYVIGILILSILLFGAGGFLICCKTQLMEAALLEVNKLPVFLDGATRAIITQTQTTSELNLETLHNLVQNVETLANHLEVK